MTILHKIDMQEREVDVSRDFLPKLPDAKCGNSSVCEADGSRRRPPRLQHGHQHL
jgi:hypothetical protein